MVQANPLDMAKTVLGFSEGKDRQALIDYMKTGGQNIDPATRAWCAAFVNASLEKAGYSGTGSDLARSFLEWGNAVQPDQIQPGDVGVWARGNDPMYGHTGLVKSYDPKTGQVVLMSGNVGPVGEGKVAEQTMDAKTALGFRRAEAVQAAGGSADQVQAAFLQTIAGPESGGAYDVLYGGKKFTDFSKHPGVYTPIESGPNRGKKSSAAGKYQFLESTWNDIAGRYGLKDFSPENQDKAAWALAAETYAQKTKGGKLQEALASNDPARINAAADILKGVWTSMPGGIEQQGYGGKTFADIYGQNYNAGAKVTHPPNPTVGAPGAAGGAPVTAATTPDKKKNWLQDTLAGFGDSAGKSGLFAPQAVPALKPRPAAALATASSTSPVDTEAVMVRRQKLAEAMARLNQGSLWG